MSTPIRETRVRVDMYTREISLIPDENITIYRGDQYANKLVFMLLNQGAIVDATGYSLTLRYILPDGSLVLDQAQLSEDKTLWCELPPAVHVQIGTVTLSLTLIDAKSIATAFELRLRVREKVGFDVYDGTDAGETLPTYERVLQLIHLLEEALNLVEEGSSQTLSQRLEGIDSALQKLQAFDQREAGFATAAQGTKAENALQIASAALPASQYTAADVLAKLKTIPADVLRGLGTVNLGAGKTPIPEGTNLNDLTTSGSYVCPTTSGIATLGNKPPLTRAFHMIVDRPLGASGEAIQLAVSYELEICVRRGLSLNTSTPNWSVWERMITSREAVRRTKLATITIPTTGWWYEAERERWVSGAIPVPGLALGSTVLLIIDPWWAGGRIPVFGAVPDTDIILLLAYDPPTLSTWAQIWVLEVG